MTSSAPITTFDPPAEPFPLRLGALEAFARAQQTLRNAGFHEDTICPALGIPSMADFGAVRLADLNLETIVSNALAVFLRLFLFVEPVSRDEVTAAIDRRTVDALLALDLLRPRATPPGAEAYYSPVLLYPVGGVLIASDRHENPDGLPFVPAADAVFPAIFAGTLRFLRILPRDPAWDALDLCSGTGIGALVLSQNARRAVAADITPRSSHFARFNCLLNGRHNVEVATGDLYDAVPGRTFDRIVAHPPYVPAAADTQIFRDGGETGEAVLQRTIAGLPQFLRRGGTFHALCAGWDTKEGPFEERVRHWLGALHQEFDVLFAVHHEMSPTDVARGLAEQAKGDKGEELRDWQHRFGTACLERRVYGALVLDRPIATSHSSGRLPITRRLRLGSLSDYSTFEWLLRWLRWRETRESLGELARVLLQLAPRLSPHARVNVAYVAQGDGLAVADAVLETDRPFAALTRIDPWMVSLVARFDGQHSAEEVYASARQASALADGFAPYDFATLVAMMIERGYLEVDGSVLQQGTRD